MRIAKVFTMSEGIDWYDCLITYDKGVFLQIRKTLKEIVITIYKKVSGYSFPFVTDLELEKRKKRCGHFQRSIPNGNFLIHLTFNRNFRILVQLIVSTLHLKLSITKPVEESNFNQIHNKYWRLTVSIEIYNRITRAHLITYYKYILTFS